MLRRALVTSIIEMEDLIKELKRQLRKDAVGYKSEKDLKFIKCLVPIVNKRGLSDTWTFEKW